MPDASEKNGVCRGGEFREQCRSSAFLTLDRGRVVALVLWPIAAVLVLQRSVILGVNGSRTDRLRAGVPGGAGLSPT